MRRLVLALLVACVSLPNTARAESLGIGVFVGEPLGLDLKIDLARRTALDFVFGATTIRDNRVSYGHVTYLLTPFMARGRSVLVPFRLGVGAALYGALDDDTNLAVRFPFEIGFRFRRQPIEIYVEIAIKLTLLDENDNNEFFDLDGGVGLRIYF
jgi:hypothetical protein